MTARARKLSPEEENQSVPITESVEEGEWNYATDFLDLPYWRTIAYQKTDHDIYVIAEALTLPRCPNCDRLPMMLNPTGTYPQSITDEPRDNRRVEIYFIRQRFECPCGTGLSQPLPGVIKGRSITQRGANYVALAALRLSFEEVANKVGCSGKKVKELFADLICQLDDARPPLEAPEVLGIDGVCVGRRKYKRSYCLFTDIANSQILELIDKSTELAVARFLKQLPNKGKIKAITTDMSQSNINVAEKILPHAVIVIDPFHVVRKLNDAVNKVIRMKQEGLTPTEHKRLMKGGNRFLLLKRRHELTEKEKEKLEAWFREVPEFKQAYDLKEAGYDIYKSTSRQNAEKNFEKWEKKIPENLEPAFRSFVRMVRRWGPYIFNYFEHPFTNAFTESKNRDIKSLQRQGRRISFTVLRARFVYAHIALKPPRPKVVIKPQQIREAMEKASKVRRPPNTWDPNSYVARINNARKGTNAFSRLMRPPKEWEDRFGHYSYYSEEESPCKWDFHWAVDKRPKKTKS
jgi:transposase